MEPELVEEFVQAFQKELNQQRHEGDLIREANKRKHADVLQKLNGLIDAIADGLRTPGLQQRLEELEQRRVELEEDVAATEATPVRLHPNLAQLYRRKVEQLQEALQHPEIRDEAIQVLRGLLERVTVAPIEGGFDVEIVGEIAQMIEVGLEKGKAKEPVLNERMARSVKVVAGVGFEPTTFRL